MTPAALTPAAQVATRRRKAAPKAARPASVPRPATAARAVADPASRAASRTSSARSAGHRGAVRTSATPRRVSGPITGTPRRRRVSGPIRGGATSRPATRRPGARPITLPRPGTLAARASVFVRTLPDHRLLDRVVRGRSWIPILGLLLTGIVAMQVETLRLSANTGRSLERVTALQSLNQQLRASDAVLGDDQRIERLAAGMNMVMPGPTQVHFLASHGGSVSRALGSVHAPDSAGFLAALPTAASTASTASTGSAATPATSTTSGPVTPAATPAVAASVPAANTGTTATGVASASAAGMPTAPSATNTGVASTGSTAASPSPASSGTPAPVTPTAPSATTPNGAAGVPSGG